MIFYTSSEMFRISEKYVVNPRKFILKISSQVEIPENEVELSGIRAQGAGGQHVNKVSTAIHLRFDIRASSLPEFYKMRLLALKDGRISREGVVNIKSQQSRSQEKNKEHALNRLEKLIKSVTVIARKRKKTEPSLGSRKKRLEDKSRHSLKKNLRKKVV